MEPISSLLETKSSDCFLKVFDGDSRRDSKRLFKKCGHELPDPVTSTSNIMLVLLTVDQSVEDKGFRANYAEVHDEWHNDT